MSSIPREKSLDSTLALLSEGYTFIGKRCEHYHSDVFQTRLMLRQVFCRRGKRRHEPSTIPIASRGRPRSRLRR